MGRIRAENMLLEQGSMVLDSLLTITLWEEGTDGLPDCTRLSFNSRKA